MHILNNYLIFAFTKRVQTVCKEFTKYRESKVMKNKSILKENLKSNPYRGVLREIANEQGVTRQGIWNAIYKHQNPRILEILSAKMRQRKLQFKNTKEELQAI